MKKILKKFLFASIVIVLASSISLGLFLAPKKKISSIIIHKTLIKQ